MAFESNVRRSTVISHSFSLRSLTASALLLTVLLLIFETNVAQFFEPPTLLPPNDWFHNGTHASPWCETTFRCDTSSRHQTLPACSCHPNCSLYDACCEDVRPSDWRRHALPSDTHECALYPILTTNFRGVYSVSGPAHVFLITKCSSAYSGSCLARLCDFPTGGAGDDKLNFTWVSDRLTGVTYKNKFCALCHGLAEEEMTFWSQCYECINEPAFARFGLNGCEHNVLLSYNVTSKLPRCSGPYFSRCSNGSSQLMQEACTDSPARYIYDYNSFTTYRNYNCSLCDSPSSSSDWRCNPPFIIIEFPLKIDATTLVSGFSGCISKRMACDTEEERRFIKELCIATDTVTNKLRLWEASSNASPAPVNAQHDHTSYSELGIASESTRLLPVTLPIYVLSALVLVPA